MRKACKEGLTDLVKIKHKNHKNAKQLMIKSDNFKFLFFNFI